MKIIEKESIQHSLDLPSLKLVDFADFLFQDFDEVSTNTDTILKMIEEGLLVRSAPKVLDLCCGKGANLIGLAEKFGWTGLGIDLMPMLTSEAKFNAFSKGVKGLVEFETGDIKAFLSSNQQQFDLIIFPFSEGILGNFEESIEILAKHLSDDGLILISANYENHGFDFGLSPQASENQGNLNLVIADSSLSCKSKQVTDSQILLAYREKELQWLSHRSQELETQYPELKPDLLKFLTHHKKITQKHRDKLISHAYWLLAKA